MSRRRLERQIGAYRDGDLSERQAEALRQRLVTDPEARLELAHHEVVGRLTREAWSEGPPGPSPEMLIAALRPEMARIDRELEETRPAPWRGWLTPAPLFAIGAAAALLALAVLQPDGFETVAERAPAPLVAGAGAPPAPENPGTTQAGTAAEREIPVYDLAQGDSPLMLFEDEGTTYIWLIEPERLRDDLSALPGNWA